MKTATLVGRVACICLCFVGSASSDTEVRFEALPQTAEPSVYYDIDVHGRILEIDYPARTGRVLGKIPIERVPPAASLFSGRYIPSQRFAYLFHSPPFQRNVSATHPLCTYDLDTGVFERHDFVLDESHEDGRVFAISRRVFLFQAVDQERAGFYDPSTKTFQQDAGVSLRGLAHNVSVFPAEDRALFYARSGHDTELTEYDAKQRSASQFRLSEFFPLRTSDTIVSIGHLSSRYALVGLWEQGSDASRRALVEMKADGSRLHVLASQDLPLFPGEVRLCLTPGGDIIIYRFGLDAQRGQFTGVIERYCVEEGKDGFREMSPMSFDPKAEVALLSSDGEIEIARKCIFDYVSMSEMELALYGSAFDATTWDERESVVREIENGDQQGRWKRMQPNCGEEPVVEHLALTGEE